MGMGKGVREALTIDLLAIEMINCDDYRFRYRFVCIL